MKSDVTFHFAVFIESLLSWISVVLYSILRSHIKCVYSSCLSDMLYTLEMLVFNIDYSTLVDLLSSNSSLIQ